MLNTIVLGDCTNGIANIADASVDMVLTDPPYFLDGLDGDWDLETITKKMENATGTIKSLPKGMKFDSQQGRDFEAFYEPLSKELFRVLKPGGFFLSFSQARLYHRMVVAIENAGFDIRDMIGWTYEGQAKAFSQTHFIEKNKKMSAAEKARWIAELDGWKTPQLKPMIEPISLGQKPCEGTLVENWIKYRVGLMNTNARLDPEKFPGNIIPVKKPNKDEKGDFNTHISVKPVTLIRHLIELYTPAGAIVLDPFMGSGTTAVAAIETGRNFIGFEKNPVYHAICEKRVSQSSKSDAEPDDSFFKFKN